jgi:hypothetical protein
MGFKNSTIQQFNPSSPGGYPVNVFQKTTIRLYLSKVFLYDRAG